MFKKLLQFEVFYQVKQRAFPIFAVLFLFLGVFVGRQGFAPTGINYNSVYQVYFHTSLFTLGSVFIIMFFAISAMLRDKQHNMELLIYSSSIQKVHYFWSRFIGTFIFSVLAFTPFILGYIFGNYFSDLDAERLGKFQLLTYVQPWLYIVVPNIFICSAIIFSVCTLTKNSIATYVSAVFVYMLYFVSSIFLNSPLLAQAVPASPESMAIAAVADPFGIAAFFEQTQYWTPFQKNTQLLSFSGLFLWNRLVWIVVGLGILFGTYRLLSFRKITKKVKKAKKVRTQNFQLVTYKSLETVHNFKAQYVAFLALLKIELKSVFKSLPFIAVLIMWLAIVFSELYTTVISGGEYGVSQYPFTNQLISLIVNPLTLFSLILIIFYSSEIVWKERSLNFNLIVDAVPTNNSVFFLSKFFAILLLPVILIITGIIMCILFQIRLNYTNFEFSLYASLYYHYGLQLAVFSMIGLFISSIAKSKYLGMGVFGLFVLLSLKSDAIGLEHPITSLGFMPRISYTNMNGFYGGLNLFNHLAVYWLAFGLLIMLVTFKIWNRGVVANFSTKLRLLKSGFTTFQKISFSFLIIVFISFGSVIFYNMNIVSDYVTTNDSLEYREQYEKKFKLYEDLERPYAISRKTEVAIFPEEQRYTVKADYILKNGSEQPLSKVFVTERLPLESITIENADLVTHNSVYGVYLFQFKKPLQPNDSVRYNFELKHKLKGYEEDKTIVNNGTYITHRNFEPILGYSSGMEITDKIEREKRHLPKREEEIISDEHIALEDFNNEKTNFETIVSTSSSQTALSSGNLVKQWSDKNRNYYHYKSENKVIPMVAYFSANYKTKKVAYKGISIEQYFDEAHAFNIEEIENSTKQTLNYCEENFGNYAFDHVRIAEVPSHWSFGGFAHPGVISMVEDRLYLADVRNDETFNLVAKRTIHEVAHQYWGHTLSAKPVAGGSIFVEGFAKYTEAVVMEKMYGKRAVYELSENARRRYFSGRSFATDLEPPVYKVLGQGYISYGKALNVMLALRDLIGEEQVNHVLKTLTDTYRNSNTLEANTIEFLDLVYNVTPKEQHHLIDDWFKKIITYDLSIEESSYVALENGTYEITATVNAKRFETISDGKTVQIEINEPIKIGAFITHPSLVKEDSSVIYYESNQINKEITEVKFIVSEIPNYIAIDPYGTRSDENLVDNVFRF
jgi:hypothetical protein|tara:strand:+ start:35336 stop:38893 length:3558 start_codon:yes stop_codon:yes gene_type:complete